MFEEAQEQNEMGLFNALKSVSDRLRSLAEVMHEMNGFEPGARITLDQNQVDILVSKLLH